MMSRTHVATGILATIVLSEITKVDYNYFELLPGAILGSTFPDIDTAQSWASQTIPLVDDTLRKFKVLKHRGLTHGITGSLAILIVYYFIQNTFMLGFSIGYISHCFLDFTTKKAKITTASDKTVYNIIWILNVFLFIIRPFSDIDIIESFKINLPF